MRLVSRTDVDATPEALFGALADRDWAEAQARRSGAVVERTDASPVLAEGSGWDARFSYRGRERRLTSRVTAMEAPGRLALAGESGGFATSVDVALTPLSRATTRMTVAVEIRPHSFTARLILQTLKIGKGRLKDRLDARVAALGEGLKERARQRANR